MNGLSGISGESRRRTRVGAVLASLVTSILVCLLLFTDAGEAAWLRLKVFPRDAALLYGALAVAALALRALRYELLLGATGNRPGRALLFAVTGVRNMLVDALPARIGEASYFYVLHRAGISPDRSASTFGVSFLLDVLALFILLSIFVFIGPDGLPSGALFDRTPLFALSLVAIVVALGVLFSLSRLLRWVASSEWSLRTTEGSGWPARIGSLLNRFLSGISADIDVILKPRILLSAMVLTILLRIVKYLSLYILFLGAFHAIPDQTLNAGPLTIIVSFLFAEGAASLPASGIMGFGSYEAVLSLALAQGGISIAGSDLLGVSFVIHVVTQIVGYGVGLISMGALLLYFRSQASPSQRT